jgi:6-pyruvoyl-tetrahydropterin synthase
MFLQRVYKSTFEASHFIKDHEKCGTRHGHSYKLIVYMNGDTSKWEDFADIKNIVDSYVQTKYDHKDLDNISAEEIAGDIARYLTEQSCQGKLELQETEKYSIMLAFGSIYVSESTKLGGIKFAKYVKPNVSNQ